MSDRGHTLSLTLSPLLHSGGRGVGGWDGDVVTSPGINGRGRPLNDPYGVFGGSLSECQKLDLQDPVS